MNIEFVAKLHTTETQIGGIFKILQLINSITEI